jgi:hypothetical protein
MSEKEELLEWLSNCIEDGLNLDEYALPGDREKYNRIVEIVESYFQSSHWTKAYIPIRPKVTKKQIEKILELPIWNIAEADDARSCIEAICEELDVVVEEKEAFNEG